MHLGTEDALFQDSINLTYTRKRYGLVEIFRKCVEKGRCC